MGGDKLHHFVAYMTLMVFWCVAQRASTWSRQALVAVACSLLGFAIECAQGMTTYRFFDWYDVAANAGGVVIGWGLTMVYWFVIHRRQTQTGA